MNLLNIFSIFDLQKVDDETYSKLASRREAIRKAGNLGMKMAAATMPLVMAAMPKIVNAQTNSIKDTLNFALTLEYLEAEFYKMGIAANGLIPSTDRAVMQQISKHEDAHVAFLKSALGMDAVSKPEFDFTAGGAFADVFTNYQTFLALSQGFEDTGVRAYKGQAGNLMSDNDILTAALQIHSVEARHASVVRRMRMQKGWIEGGTAAANGMPSATDAIYKGEDNTMQGGVAASAFTTISSVYVMEAFDEPLEKQAVLDIAGLFIK